jgi:iron complex outermembrane receptor protein
MVIPRIGKVKCHWLLPMLLASHGTYAKELSEVDFLTGGTMVLTASRLAQPIMDAPNAITVIDRATIEASGYHNLTDLFRLVPGMYVGQMKGWFHNVSHTIADEYARRMQVLVDGRSVYLPSIGGVRWDALPLALDDIERIEVVRGANAATFGANAFTGVINIITRHPEDVPGRMLHLVTGDQKHREGWFRWAGATESTSHRLTLGRREDGGFAAQLDDERSDMLSYRGEFRLSARQNLGVQFGYLAGTRGEGDRTSLSNRAHDQDVTSYFAQADYRLSVAPGGEVVAKLYLNHQRTYEFTPTYLANTFYEVDLLSRRWHGEVQYNLDHGDGLRSSMGVFLRSDVVRSQHFWNTTSALQASSSGAFGHLEWRMAPAWLLNAGAFLEDYEMVGTRLSPRITLNWQPSTRHTVRIGVSKAYRNPVLFETSANWNLTLLNATGNPIPGAVFGPYLRASGNIKPEEMLNREIAYLGQFPEAGVDVDLRVFRERISDYISAECTVAPTALNPKPCSFTIPAGAPRDFFNIGGATQEGVEGQLKWRPRPHTQILANYAFLHIDSRIQGEERYSPSHLAGLHLMHQFPGDFHLTLSHYWTSSFKPIGRDILPASRRWDAQVAKGFSLGHTHAHLAFGVENLGDSYIEFSNTPENLFDTRGYVHLKVDF